jgi:hypothetical protein
MDGAGLAKMATLDQALTQLTRIHAIVERMAIEVRAQKNTAQMRQQVQRSATPLVGLLKGQFGMISDLVSALILVLSRGGSDQTRLRSLREFVAQIRTALEIAVTKTKELHTSGGDSEKPERPEI